MTDHAIQRYMLKETRVVEPTRESAAKWAQQWSKRPGEAYGLDPDEDGTPTELFVNGVAFRRADREEGE